MEVVPAHNFDELASMLASIVAPGDETEVARLITVATELDDEGLGRFLERLAALIRQSPRRIRADQVAAILP